MFLAYEKAVRLGRPILIGIGRPVPEHGFAYSWPESVRNVDRPFTCAMYYITLPIRVPHGSLADIPRRSRLPLPFVIRFTQPPDCDVPERLAVLIGDNTVGGD